jgi:hypothetical protein
MNFVRIVGSAVAVMCSVGIVQADSFMLKDGAEVEGTVLRTSADGRVTIRTAKGISTFGVLEFSDETQIEHFEELAESILLRMEAVDEGQAGTDAPVKTEADSKRHKGSRGKLKAKTPVSLAVMGAGAVLFVIGSLWFAIATFSVSPLWGIALILSSGIASLAFLVLHWDDARNPFYASVLGVALIVGGMMLL